MTLYEYIAIYFIAGLLMYLCDEFDNETDTPEFNFRDAITFTLLGAAIKLKYILIGIKNAVAGGSQKLGLIAYIKAVFARHFKAAPKKDGLKVSKGDE